MDGLADIVVAPENWAAFWPDSRDLILAHRRELEQDDPRAPLDPPHGTIMALANAGGLLIIAARAQGVLVGYCISYIAPSLETAGLLTALQGPWYVVPGWRQTGVGLRLWRESKRHLIARGVGPVHAHYPAKGPGSDLGKFFAREGAVVIGTEVALWLEG